MRKHWFTPRMKNLALGRPYSIGAQWPDAQFGQTERQQYPDRGQLTDGQMAGLQNKDPGWVGMLRQYGRSIVVDLGKVQHVCSMSLHFLQNSRAGIRFPYSVYFYASLDGLQWQPLGFAGDNPEWYTDDVQAQAFALEVNVNAKYIRAQFTAKVYAFIDEFQVHGQTQPTSTPDLYAGTWLTHLQGDNYLVDPGTENWGYLTAKDAASGGINHMQLVYTGSHDALGLWSSNDFLPMVAQMDTKGQPSDWLFDATLFAPYGKMPTTAAAWSEWLSGLFAKDVNLDALDQTIGRLKPLLNEHHFRESVVITLPSTTKNPSDFGGVLPDGPPLNMNPSDVGFSQSSLNKLTALRWIMKEALQKWRQANFVHLQLAGFYWQPESVHAGDPYDPRLIQQMAADIHAENLRFYWIPFYGAIGVTVGRQLGFDAVLIQPGVSFHWDVDANLRLRSVAEMAEFYHYGVEIELHWDITNSGNLTRSRTALSKYKEYFAAGHVYGYDGDVTKAYYLNSKSLVQCSLSALDEAHQAYTDTVQFIGRSHP